MTEQVFKEKMADILYRDDVPDLDTPLNEIEEWDSVAYVAFVAMASDPVASGGKPVKLQAAQIRNAETLRDLYNLVNKG